MTDTPRNPDEGRSNRYWYDGNDSPVALLSALRAFRVADQELRRRMSEGMDMNTTDLAALRFVIANELSAEPVTPLRLAANLRISGPSTSKLIDRLTASGHLRRVPHPEDGRSRIVIATDHAHSQVRERLGHMHERMLEIAQQVPAPARAAAIAFLQAMAEQLDAEAAPPELTQRGT
ncbi:MarR family winged helix-turn-helix transcriptional regulator [Brachybacterium sp. AOP42-C2-15]|uniref:MarR family winged helix-turn-helix transcriptional regulator n=1 Tax=unclassified Brachybacterium TaxID=2623841 RepID=UPI003F8F2217